MKDPQEIIGLTLKDAIEEARKQNKMIARISWPDGRQMAWSILEAILRDLHPGIKIEPEIQKDKNWKLV